MGARPLSEFESPIETRVGIVAALPAEAETLLGRRIAPYSVTPCADQLLIVSGIGPDRARTAAERLVNMGVDALVSWGTAGALSDELRAGDLLLPEQIINADGAGLPTDRRWVAGMRSRLQGHLPLRAGALALSRTVLESVTDKRRMRERTGAMAVDMESGAVAEVAERRGLSMLAIRAVVDTHRLAVPPFIIAAMNGYGEVRFSALLGGLLREPASLVDLLALARAWRSALATLGGAAALIGPALQPET